MKVVLMFVNVAELNYIVQLTNLTLAVAGQVLMTKYLARLKNRWMLTAEERK